jgi:uncharacterized protein (TIGR01777 family)
MLRQVFEKTSEMPVSAQDLFAYHERPNAFRRLNPPWEPVEILKHVGGIQDGAEVEMRLKIGPVPQRLALVHQGYIHGEQFQDRQTAGTFSYWLHTHRMEHLSEGRSLLRDKIEYQLPLGILGKTFGSAFARAKLERMFRYRHEVTRQDVALHARFASVPSQTVAVTGASGLIGGQLVPLLTTGGHTVRRLVRRPVQEKDEIFWDIPQGFLNPSDLAGMSAVVHLAGENIGAKRWTEAQKREILDSRTHGTRLLAETLAAMPNPPRTLVMASAIGYYGDAGDEILTEDSAAGSNFQAEVCKAWEAAVEPARQAGIRVVILRIGVVLAMNGGALERLLLPFLLGAGGVVGTGRQYMSWIALDDVVQLLYSAVLDSNMEGVYNASAPEPVTNREFTRVLGRILRRPTIAPLPAFAMRLVFGQLADELLLGSLRVIPARLNAAGYTFRYPTLEPALRHVLGRAE